MANGFLISELKDGGVYECRLSGLPVLIVTEPAPSGTKQLGYQYNPVTGQYRLIQIKDHQLKFPSK